ncbi:rhodanese-like domain-containing protein [Oscillatoria amoena NRMC-F 0135]|nr:MAG: rhodanese-like domain-containing protein [Bacteroidota bacterium]MDL5047762.1 rhodanese-like domain-containing protein [Oscillatoria amoena NRMC-F 0135]
MDITSEELKTRMDNGEDLIVIDVREPHEYEEFNIGGRLIPLGTLPTVVDELEDLKGEEIIVHCRSGARSGQAKAYLGSIGFTNVRNLLGGVMDWQAKYGSTMR